MMIMMTVAGDSGVFVPLFLCSVSKITCRLNYLVNSDTNRSVQDVEAEDQSCHL